MITQNTQNTLLLGLTAAVTFALSPLANAGGHGGGGGGHSHGSSIGGFNRGASFSRNGSFHRGAGFDRSTAFNRGGHFHHGHHGRFCRSGGIFFDPFYYGYGFGYPYGYGYGYGYPYGGYYSQTDYYEGDYADGNYSAEADVQTSLADLGYYKGPIDGIIGSGTRRAVRAFQRDAGLPVTGRIDRRLLNELRAS